MNQLRTCMVFLLCSMLCFGTLFAGTTGKIAGKITDAEAKEPVVGANVLVEGTIMGASTDAGGEFIISNLPPGDYTIVISALGFQKRRYVNVKVQIDFTTRLDAKLTNEAISLQEEVIQAEAPMVRKDLTSSYASVDATQIETMPVESVTGLLTLQAGIIQGVGGELHMRGGRSNEIVYTVNGVSTTNPFSSGKTVSVATNAIQELSVVSGTFNAEYGNALSGVVNTVTKEGGESYRGSLSFYTGEFFSGRKDIFFNVDAIDPWNDVVAEGTLGGPVPLLEQGLTFFVSGRYEKDYSYLYGIREHNTTDSVYLNPRDPNDIRIAMSGDNAIVPMSVSEAFSGTGKLTFRPFDEMKINYDFLVSTSLGQGYSHSLKYNPDARGTGRGLNMLHSVEIRHALSSNTFYVLQGSYNFHDYKSYTYPLLDANNNPVDFYPGMDWRSLHADPRYQPEYKMSTLAASYSFSVGGTSNGHYYERSKTYGGKFDMTTQATNNHEVKFGMQTSLHELNYQSFTVRRDTIQYLTPTILDPDNVGHDIYTKKPVEFSAYIQDKMEFENLVINVGLRYDYFKANHQYSTDTYNPSPNNPSLPIWVDKSTLLAEAPAKQQLSPRVGVSFPITDRGMIHFSYGHFYQMPPFAYLYANPNFKMNYATGTPSFGNANLNPELTVTYELGLQQQLMENVAFNITGFYKDVRDLLASQQIRISGDETYYKYVNKDYANIKGLMFSLVKRRGVNDPLSVSLDYTFQVCEGNDVSSDAFFMDLASGRQSEKIPVFLGWDQSHTLNTMVSYGQPRDYNITMIGRFGTGLPYTPLLYYNQVYLTPNSGRRPSQLRVDLMAEKDLDLGGLSISIFLKVFNLFDSLIEQVIYNDTGRSGYTLQTQQGTAKETQRLSETIPGVHPVSDYFNNPTYYGAPREVKLGLSIDLR